MTKSLKLLLVFIKGDYMPKKKDCIWQGPRPGVGSLNHRAKLNEQLVCDITDMYMEEKKITYKDIAQAYNIGTTTAYRAINRLSWVHVAHMRWD